MDSYGDSFACFYDRYFGGYAEHSAPYLLHFASTLSANGRLPRILDMGCGTGHLARKFLEAGYEVTGLDRAAARAVVKVAEFVVTDQFAVAAGVPKRVERRPVPPGE